MWLNLFFWSCELHKYHRFWDSGADPVHNAMPVQVVNTMKHLLEDLLTVCIVQTAAICDAMSTRAHITSAVPLHLWAWCLRMLR